MLPNKKVSQRFLIESKTRNICGQSESYIVRASSNTLYKIFKEDKPNILENKFQKLCKLYEKNIEFLTNPISTLSYNGLCVGYELKEEVSYKTWDGTYIPVSTVVTYLKELKKMLLKLDENGITYTDFKEDNILIDMATKKMKLCDIDNVSVDSLPSDKLLAVLKVIDLEKHPDFDVHAYMHNLFVIKEVLGISRENFSIFPLTITEREKFYINKSFTKEGLDIVEEMATIRKDPNNFSKRYLIEYSR